MIYRIFAATMFAIAAAILISVYLVGDVKATPGDQHQVWVCKYVGQPGDFETLKPGKQPIIVDVAAADAYIGADFADGQTHSLVIDLATDENTAKESGTQEEATCPVTPSPSESPSPLPSSEPSPSISPSPSTPPESAPPSESTSPPSSTPTSTVAPPSSSDIRSVAPRSAAPTLPSTDTSPSSTPDPDPMTGGSIGWLTLIILIVTFALILGERDRS